MSYIWSKGRCKDCAAREGGKKLSTKKQLKAKPPPTIQYQGKQLLSHTAIYLAAFKYDINDTFFPSEISGAPAQDVHHIIRRGLCGGDADHILNLMALTREEHEDYGDNKECLEGLIETHLKFCISRGINVSLLVKTLPDCLTKIKIIYEEIVSID